MTEVICPSCGATREVPELSSAVCTGNLEHSPTTMVAAED
jgi:hypothetical protein